MLLPAALAAIEATAVGSAEVAELHTRARAGEEEAPGGVFVCNSGSCNLDNPEDNKTHAITIGSTMIL